MFKSFLGKFLVIILLASFVLLLFILNNSTPSSAGPFGVLVVFMCVYVIIMSLLTFVIFYGQRLIKWFTKFFYLKKPFTELSSLRAYYYASVLAIGPVILLGLGTVGAVPAYVFLLIAIFMLLGCFYVAKRA